MFINKKQRKILLLFGYLDFYRNSREDAITKPNTLAEYYFKNKSLHIKVGKEFVILPDFDNGAYITVLVEEYKSGKPIPFERFKGIPSEHNSFYVYSSSIKGLIEVINDFIFHAYAELNKNE